MRVIIGRIVNHSSSFLEKKNNSIMKSHTSSIHIVINFVAKLDSSTFLNFRLVENSGLRYITLTCRYVHSTTSNIDSSTSIFIIGFMNFVTSDLTITYNEVVIENFI